MSEGKTVELSGETTVDAAALHDSPPVGATVDQQLREAQGSANLYGKYIARRHSIPESDAVMIFQVGNGGFVTVFGDPAGVAELNSLINQARAPVQHQQV